MLNTISRQKVLESKGMRRAKGEYKEGCPQGPVLLTCLREFCWQHLLSLLSFYHWRTKACKALRHDVSRMSISAELRCDCEFPGEQCSLFLQELHPLDSSHSSHTHVSLQIEKEVTKSSEIESGVSSTGIPENYSQCYF